MEKLIPFSGILSSDPAQNTELDQILPRLLRGLDSPSTIFPNNSDAPLGDALLEDWQLLYTDNFRQVLPKEATVECLADAGFFLDE
ncbi:hypothetical protein JHK82_043400 [Glycine max]|nr:hypothetical protein JHK82_043400 [Glycine max]